MGAAPSRRRPHVHGVGLTRDEALRAALLSFEHFYPGGSVYRDERTHEYFVFGPGGKLRYYFVEEKEKRNDRYYIWLQ